MKKLLFFSLVILSFGAAFGQPVVNRSLSVNTVSDARLQAQYNFFTPRYLDTTAANLVKGIDSCGAVIFTYSTNSLWTRACNPKRWVQGSGGGGTIVTDNTESVILSGTGDASDPLTADVVLSTSAPNAIQLLSDGLYVPNTIRNGLVYGGAVTWISGYTYEVSAAGYFINNVFYESPITTVSLDSADATLDRLDVFIVDNTSTASALTGVPAANPEEPDVDISTQLRLSFALVQAGTTEPTNDSAGLRRDCVYQENTEWTAAASTSRINPNSTSNPCVGLKSVEGTAVVNNDNVLFTRPGGAITILDSFQVLTFQIKSKANWGGNRRLLLKFELAGTTVGGTVTLGGASYGWSSNLLTCQTVSIPLSDFNITSGATINSFRITAAMNNGSIGFYIDNICLQNQEQAVYGTPITLQNGLNLDANTNIGELGGTLLHNTTNSTGYYIHTLSGITVYDYPYQFQQGQVFQVGTGVASFTSTGGSTYAPNTVRLGINYTGEVYSTSPAVDGYMGSGKQGYWLGTNVTGNGSFGLRVDDTTAKTAGIFFNTNDTTNTEAFTLFGVPRRPSLGTLYLNANLYDYKILTGHNNQDLQAHGYPDTRDDGVTTKALYTDASGNVKLGSISTGATYTFANGLTDSAGTHTVVLGGTLYKHTVIDGGSDYELSLTSSIPSGLTRNTLKVTNSGLFGTALYSIATNAGIGAEIQSNSGYAANITSQSGPGAQITSNSSTALILQTTSGTLFQAISTPTSTNTTIAVGEIDRNSTGTAGNGIGAYINLRAKTSTDGSTQIANQLLWKWTDATTATRTSQFIITGVNSATAGDIAYFNGNGHVGIGVDPSYRLDVLNASTGQTTNTRLANFSNSGATYNTTGGNLTSFLGYFSNTSTRASGANNLTNIGIYSTASGAQNNFAAYLDGGVVYVNAGASDYLRVDGTSANTSIFAVTEQTGGTTVFTISGDGSMKLKGLTATQASAITAADGMIVYLTSTNGTFTSVGFWGRENGTWVKL